jgi:pimeloyl-ACP methyl ester carboxylesterase
MSVLRSQLRPADEGRPGARGRTGLVVVASTAVGLVLAVVVVVLPVVPAEERALTGGVLLASAVGWGLLVVLSVRFTDRPQRWAAGPATLAALAGLAALSGSAAVHRALDWVWPPVLLALVVWMVPRVRRDLESRSRRWLVHPVLAVLVIAAVGGGYQTVSESIDRRAHPPPGQLVDVGGHRLHLQCTGSGSPTVVLEPGHGGSSSDLAWITPTVARTSRVCVYDRAGRGWSEPATGPQDAARIAADLHTLLDRAEVPGPYVLAGHSFGGLYVLSFAAQFPRDVAGMVLLDSTAPRPGPARPAGRGSATVLSRVAALVPAVGHLGVPRLLVRSAYDGLPPEVQDAARANGSTVRDLDSSLEEFLQGSASMRQAASLADLGAKPLVVLTADTGSDATWQADQRDLATLSSDSVHRHAQTTHGSLVADPADSAAASQAVVDVVTALRTGRPLARR